MAKNYRINWANLPEDPDGMTFADVKLAYTRLHKELAQAKAAKGTAESVLHKTAKDMRKARGEAKVLRRDMVQMTRKQKAADELKACGAWSGAAIGCCTLLWQAFEQYGAPFPKFMVESEWFFGSVCWAATMIFGWAAKAFHEAD